MQRIKMLFLLLAAVESNVVRTQGEAVSVFDIQYSTASDGRSPYHQTIVNCLGGVVTHKVSRSVPRLVLQDPIIRNAGVQGAIACWGAIQIKDWTYGSLINSVDIGDWIELDNVPVEDYRGTTFLQYGKGNVASNFRIVGGNHPVPGPLAVSVRDITRPLEDPTDYGCYYAANHDAERFESMWLRVRNVHVVGKDLGKAGDNYVLQSDMAPSDPNFSCWAADYMNGDAVDYYHPCVDVGRHFCSVEGIFEQYTNLGDGFDYYQLITTGTNDFAITQPGDLDEDCDVDFGDLGAFAGYWSVSCAADPNWCGRADVTQDDIVDGHDLSELTSNWLEGY